MELLIGLTTFVTGFVTLSVEVLGFRVLAPHFGYSTYVFGSLIGSILLALSLGYWIGGLCSRRRIREKHFFMIVLAAGLYLGGANAIYQPLLERLEQFGVVEGALLGTVLLWCFPLTAFAAVSPFLVEMRARVAGAGHSAGWISAIGTVGGLVGTFLTSFVALPTVGAHVTFTIDAFVAVGVPVWWLYRNDKRWVGVGLGVQTLLAVVPQGALPSDVLHAEESAYSRLEVINYSDRIGLRTDYRSGTVYSVAMKDRSLPPFRLYNLFAVPIVASNARHALLLGAGAGTLPRIHEILNPGLRITGVEIDSRVIVAGRKFFGLNDAENIDHIAVVDARPFIAQETHSYGAIEMDVFRTAEIPFYLATREFFELTRARLERGGVFVMNVYDPTKSRAVISGVANTLAAVYQHTYLVPAEPGSFLLVARMEPLTVPSPDTVEDQRLARLIEYFTRLATEVRYSPTFGVLTDDRAPLERLYRAH